MFTLDNSEGFVKREERVLRFWKEQSIFKKSLNAREGNKLFAFYDGPPFATGLPHYGHILAGTIKDVVPRYKTMKGYFVPRRFGWDCHGLPVENEIEKARELSGAAAIESFGIKEFNEECRSIVLRYTSEWESTVLRMGRWVDFAETYKTMDLPFMESVWWAFSRLYEQGLVYEGYKVMPFSAKLGTPLSNFEANLNYKDVDDPSLTVTFPLIGDDDVSFLAWTTTPWTLPSNLALTVGPEIEYIKIVDKKSSNKLILAKARLSAYFKSEDEYEILESFLGKSLAGMRYKPLFTYFVDEMKDKAFRVLVDEFVTTEDGTGIVHTAPAFGETDFYVCKKEGIDPVCPIDQNGKFTSEIPEYAGQFVKDADKEIIRRLKQEGRVYHHGQIRHRYPFCWRSDTPLIYKAVSTWFVAVEKIKDKLLAANEEITWVPGHIKEGRFGKWLENARDWAISRNRYWGTPIPIWRNEEGHCIVISSVKELEERTGKKIHDLHRHHIDDLSFTENGKLFKRVTEVFDCWFESGSMPYAQNHYPFENKEHFENSFPADFIAEGLDQTRGWFYTLTVLAAALFDKPAFKNVIVNGIILAEDGNKMSKRLKNYPEPTEVINKYGADAVRLYLMSSPAVMADDLKFSERGVELILRQVLIPLWNSYAFLAMYAKIYNWKPSESKKFTPEQDIDKWMLSASEKLVKEVSEALDAYTLPQAVNPIVEFVDQLTNWYIRRNRARFWSDIASKDRDDAFQTLYMSLMKLIKVMAPFTPFISEAIYSELRTDQDLESVHLCDFPLYEESQRLFDLEDEMRYVQAVVSNGHALRKENKVKVRQPLRKAYIVTCDEEKMKALKAQQHLIADELNVKEVVFHQDETSFVTLVGKPNFRTLGRKVGKLMKEVQALVATFDQKTLRAIMGGESLTVEIQGESLTFTSDDILVERQVLQDTVAATVQDITVVLDLVLTEELLYEGLAREIVNKINTMRRDDGFDVVDRIHVVMETTPRVQKAFELHKDYICHEVLAGKVEFTACEGKVWDLNGEEAKIALSKI